MPAQVTRPGQGLAAWMADGALLLIGVMLLPFVFLLLGAPFVLLLRALMAVVPWF